MNNKPKNHRPHLNPLIAAIAALCVISTAQAKSLTEASTLLEAAGDPNESSFMKSNQLKIGGWANAGVTYNATDPGDKFNGPVTFGDRSAEFQLNQLNLFAQRTVATEGDSFDVGGRVDVMFGSDAIFTQAYGVPGRELGTGQVLDRGAWDLKLINERFYNLAIPQAFLEMYIPVGNGLNVKVGHFYTPIGFETVPAPDNFFYTHAYTMQFGEPFTHTGVMANYTIDDNWAVMGGVVTGSATGGWDGSWDQQLGNWAGLMGATWTSTSKATSFNISGTYGARSELSDDDWSLYSMVFKHNITDKMHLVLQHDHGFADGLATSTGLANTEWYGINTHLYYDIQDNLVAGIRGEWFRDQNGVRVCNPARTAANCQAGTFYAVTAGVTWKPMKWLNIRPNVRYDWVDTNATTGQLPFDGGNQKDQFLFSTDMTIAF
ncbi:porin [Methyloglobulus sp.]|uniref:porin n=1 Tax=Methyloglobulus sp. TaxID=2518622 RepID=UPI0032B78CCF